MHRPGTEFSRLTPQNIGDLLFDDVLWAKKAKEEHDAFAEALRDKGVQVHYFGQLLAETLGLPEGLSFVLDRVCTTELLGRSLINPVRRLFDDLTGDDDANHFPAAVEGGDVHVLGNGAVLIGMGERTTPMAVEQLARALFASVQPPPSSRSSCRAPAP